MTAKKKAPPKPARRRLDWEAIERDYRTGNFSLKELEAKHGAGYAAISRKATKDGWTKDLTQAVKQATAALVIAETTKRIANEVQSTTDVVQTADVVMVQAEVNKRVILAHRDRAARAIDVTMRMLQELDLTTSRPGDIEAVFEKMTEDLKGTALTEWQARFREFMRLHGRIASVHKLMDALARAQVLEAQAYGNLYEGDKSPADELEHLTDEELNGKIKSQLERLGVAAPMLH